MSFPPRLLTLARKTITQLTQQNHTLALAESCTGGLVSALLTAIPGASTILDRCYVTYSNQAKIELLTVPTYFIEQYGAVSKETAIAMAEGALLNSHATIAASITGIAGPDGGSEEKPVGTVFIALAQKHHDTIVETHHFKGDRADIRWWGVQKLLEMVQSIDSTRDQD